MNPEGVAYPTRPVRRVYWDAWNTYYLPFFLKYYHPFGVKGHQFFEDYKSQRDESS